MIPLPLPGTDAARRLALRVLGVAALLVLGGVLIWWIVARPGAAIVEAAKARGETRTAEAETDKARAAIGTIGTTSTHIREIEQRTVTNERIIREAPGAGDAMPAELHRAGLAALCLHDSYRAQPACQQLHHPDS